MIDILRANLTLTLSLAKACGVVQARTQCCTVYTLALIAVIIKIISNKYLASVCLYVWGLYVCVRRGVAVQVQWHLQQS